jgi:glycosidase
LRTAVKVEKSDALLLGEVWEDASNKCSYGCRRPYLNGNQLDSVMNYPFANALIDYIQHGCAQRFVEKLLSILENYPPPSIHTLMNHIGTHDTVRAITLLAGGTANNTCENKRAMPKLDASQRKKGLTLMKLISAIQFTLPGVPSIYYGDEVGLEGGQDPFNRACYPWGHEDTQLLEHYKSLGFIRKICPALIDGDFEELMSCGDCLAFARNGRGNSVLTVANRGETEIDFTLNKKWNDATVLLGNQTIDNGKIKIPANEAVILTLQDNC